jgi:hypothetical protein
MALIPQMNLTDFKHLKAGQIKELKSVEVISDGQYVFTAIIPPLNRGTTITDNIKTQAEYLAVKSNSVGGKDPDAALSV